MGEFKPPAHINNYALRSPAWLCIRRNDVSGLNMEMVNNRNTFQLVEVVCWNCSLPVAFSPSPEHPHMLCLFATTIFSNFICTRWCTLISRFWQNFGDKDKYPSKFSQQELYCGFMVLKSYSLCLTHGELVQRIVYSKSFTVPLGLDRNKGSCCSQRVSLSS